MIITHFPKTLGGISFEKLVNYFGGRKTELFRCVVFPSPNPPTFPGNDQRGFPFGNPKLMFFFLFLLLVVISFSYLAIYTNEYLLLLNNVDIFVLRTIKILFFLVVFIQENIAYKDFSQNDIKSKPSF